MKKLTAFLGVLLFISLLLGASPAKGNQWVWVHGSAGNYPTWINNNPASKVVNPDATGLNITFPSDFLVGAPPTIYYSVPTINGGTIGANRVGIKFRGLPATGGAALISQITITNGEEIILLNWPLWGEVGYFEESLDLGRTVIFDKGLCIAVEVTPNFGPNPQPDDLNALKIIAVGAYFNFNVQAASNPPAINSLLLGD